MLEHHLEGLLGGQKGQFPYWWRCLRTYLQWTDMIFKKSDLMEHEINTGDYPPVKQPPHCALPHQREIVDKNLGKLLASGRVEKSRCPWSNPVGQETWTYICVMTFKDSTSVQKNDIPLPRTVGGAQGFLLHLNLTFRYWKMQVEEEDRPTTAFSSYRGQF